MYGREYEFFLLLIHVLIHELFCDKKCLNINNIQKIITELQTRFQNMF